MWDASVSPTDSSVPNIYRSVPSRPPSHARSETVVHRPTAFSRTGLACIFPVPRCRCYATVTVHSALCVGLYNLPILHPYRPFARLLPANTPPSHTSPRRNPGAASTTASGTAPYPRSIYFEAPLARPPPGRPFSTVMGTLNISSQQRATRETPGHLPQATPRTALQATKQIPGVLSKNTTTRERNSSQNRATWRWLTYRGVTWADALIASR